MKQLKLVLVVLVLLVSALSAQTTALRLAWDQPLAGTQTFADVQAFAWTLRVDAAAATALVATCTAGTPIKCTAPLPALVSGPHTVTLTGTNAFGSGSGSVSGQPPASPINISVTVTVTVP